MDDNPTIAAIATAPGRGGVAVVRVSGPDAFAVARRVAGRAPAPGRVLRATLRAPGTGAPIDDALLVAFAAPHSYTGEDVAEFQCHGGSVTPRRVLEAAFAAGARLARRGEFTLRAFLNGKMPLSAAESVIELVDAKTDRAADDALARQDGGAERAYRALYDSALALSTTLEHALDVDEGELPATFMRERRAELAALRTAIDGALVRARGGRLLREGALVVLAGPPNAGKSSLMNALLGASRAIVSPTPGTTRDSIEEWLDLDGWPVRLVDTAGLRETGDAVEAEGVRRAEALVERADIVLMLSPDGAHEARDSGREARAIAVHSKCDLARGEGLNVSAATGEGLDELKAAIVARLVALGGGAEAGPTPSEREGALLAEAAATLRAAPEGDIVLMANAVRRAAETLGRLVGAAYSDDLLESLFSRFCVGK